MKWDPGNFVKPLAGQDDMKVKLLYPLGLLVLNAVLKILFLDARDIALDEPFTIFYAQSDFHTLFTMLKTENNPPFYFLLLHYWIKLFGISAFAVRIPSFLFSVAIVYFIYWTGVKFFSLRAGIIASLVFSFSNYHMLFAHEARVYSLFALLTTISMYLFLSLYRDPGKKKLLILLLATNVILVYSHFFGWFVILIQVYCVVLIKSLRKEISGRYFIITAILLLSYLPYYPVFISRFITTSAKGTWVSTPVLSDLYTMVWRFSNVPLTTVVFLLLLASAGIKYFISADRRKGIPVTLQVVLAWFLFPYFLMFLVSWKVPMFLDRYMIFISPAYYLLVSVFLVYLFPSRKLFYIVATAAVLLMVIWFNPNEDNKRRLGEAVSKIKELKQDKTVVLICPEWLDLGFMYHYDPQIFCQYRTTRTLLASHMIFPLNHPEEIDTNLFRNASNVIYFEEWATMVDKDNMIYQDLSRRFRKQEVFRFYENYRVYNFTRE
jgi:mannosyltransferase